jgi:hypothetical protein
MQRLEVSCAVRPIYGSLGAKGLKLKQVVKKKKKTKKKKKKTKKKKKKKSHHVQPIDRLTH